MNQDIKKRWVQALRSGQYPQAKDALHTVDGFCCLGVLCEIAVRDGVIAHDPPTNTEEGTYYRPGAEFGQDSSSGTLPPSVWAWAGLDAANPKVEVDGRKVCLSTLNDGGHECDTSDIAGDCYDATQHSFAEIADLIDAQL